VSYAKAHPGEAATPMPASSTIAIDGDVAIVRHRDPQHVSVDVFKKEGGAWRALYSQHTRVGAAAG
jgi:hypothetical protein